MARPGGVPAECPRFLGAGGPLETPPSLSVNSAAALSTERSYISPEVLNLLFLRKYNSSFGVFLSFPGQAWPRDPLQRVRLYKWCRTRLKLAPETKPAQIQNLRLRADISAVGADIHLRCSGHPLAAYLNSFESVLVWSEHVGTSPAQRRLESYYIYTKWQP